MYDFDQQVKSALAQHGKAVLLKDADIAYQSYKQQQRTKIRFMYQAAAAAAVVIIAASVWFSIPSALSNPEQLFESYYQAPTASAERGQPVETSENWQKALIAFNKQDYASAITLIGQTLNEPAFKQQDAAWYYLGQAHLAQKQLPAALVALKKVRPNSLLYPDARWYMALAALANHQEPESILILKTIATDDTHHKQNDAKNLLKQLGE
jgi:tetratricopeptide (TPR) repeat protein